MRATEFIIERLDEAVGGNYLYHATSASGLKGMISSGSIRSATGPQMATSAQTKLPTVSVTRDWGYANGAQAQSQLGGIGRDAILVLDRNAVESNFKTLGTSQSTNIKGLSLNPYLKKDGEARSQNTDPMARTNAKAKAKYAEPTAKAGGEFEEAVVVPKGALPLKGTMVGFWVNPKSELMKDPAIMNDPRRLDMVRPNQFVKAKQAQDVAENMDHSKDSQAVPELKAALLAKKQKLQAATDDQVYDIIDSIMTRIAKSHGMSGQKLHDMWVKEYNQIPDTWIMK